MGIKILHDTETDGNITADNNVSIQGLDTGNPDAIADELSVFIFN
jgi:hypothetical protein